MSTGIRVLHIIPDYLPVTQNWIHPQVMLVPGVSSAVLCNKRNKTVAEAEFPLNGRPLWRRELNLPGLATGPKPFRAVRRLVNIGAKAVASRQARLWKPEIIHAHFGTTGWENLSFRKTLAAPLITSFYGFDAWQLPTTDSEWRLRYAQLFACGDLFLVEGPAFRQRLVELGCAAEKVRIQRLGIDVKRLEYRGRDFTGPLKIVMIGRFAEKKGLVDGLTACTKASAAGVDLDVTIVGDAWHEELDSGGQRIKRELLEIANFPEMSNRVHFMGQLSYEATLQILATQDIFLCPSKHGSNGDAEGGLPVVLMEAMGMGLLCLGSRHCDIPEAIIDETTGFLFEEGNIGQLAKLIERISRLPERALPIVTAARKHVEQNFNRSCLLPILGELYRGIAGPPNQLNGANRH
jgi:colanic acid/amylovoran biosynthesis glycosyltransferase